jgi:hypothetical protein
MPFVSYEREAQREHFAQFKGTNFKAGRSFVIGAADASVLSRTLNARADALPGYAKSEALILTRPSGHKELWLDPQHKDYREAHLAFFDTLGIHVPTSILKSHHSDHAYPKSAARTEAGLVMMNLINSGANCSFGGGWEKRLTHRILDSNGLATGTLIDLFKSMGGRLPDPKDLPGSIMAIHDLLIGAGQAPATDRGDLVITAEQALGHWQDQDTAYAIRTGQY